jgi:hypothetical protein
MDVARAADCELMTTSGNRSSPTTTHNGSSAAFDKQARVCRPIVNF